MHPLTLLLVVACGHPVPGDGSVPPTPEELGCQTAQLGDHDAFFDVSGIGEIRITLSGSSLAALNDDPRVYTTGEVEIDGTTLLSVGVRLKGNSSFQELDGKAAFKLKLNEYCAGQKYAGLKGVTLNNMSTDPTQSQEMINYQLWEAAGLNAPHATYAQVYLNDELYGLYASVESMDSEWIGARYADATGDLWEAGEDAEFDDAHLVGWELKEGTGDGTALAAVAAALLEDGAVYDNLDAVLSMDQYLSYWAWKVIVGDDDGYPWNPNDVFLYGDPAIGGRFEFSPWGFDEGWKDHVAWDNATGTLSVACLADADCSKRFRARLVEAVATFESIDTVAFAEAAWALSEPVLAADTRRGLTVDEVEAAREELRDVIVGRADEVLDDL